MSIFPSHLFARIRLFIRVMLNGCRIMAVESLKCDKCAYGPICDAGYFRAKD